MDHREAGHSASLEENEERECISKEKFNLFSFTCLGCFVLFCFFAVALQTRFLKDE